MEASLRRVLGNPNHIRLMRLLRNEAPLRFNEIQAALGLGPSVVHRAIQLLKEGLWILPTTIPTKGDRVFVEWRLSGRGRGLMEAWDAFDDGIHARLTTLGEGAVREFDAVYA